MKYYVDSIEQVKAEESYSEYGKRTKKNSYESALSEFYDGLATIAKSKNHLSHNRGFNRQDIEG